MTTAVKLVMPAHKCACCKHTQTSCLHVQLIQAILLEYRHIETFLESSAKKQQSIPDIFYYAVKSVVHPAEPLVEFTTGQLKPLCVKALKRIFLLCDINAVGIKFVRLNTPPL